MSEDLRVICLECCVHRRAYLRNELLSFAMLTWSCVYYIVMLCTASCVQWYSVSRSVSLGSSTRMPVFVVYSDQLRAVTAHFLDCFNCCSIVLFTVRNIKWLDEKKEFQEGLATPSHWGGRVVGCYVTVVENKFGTIYKYVSHALFYSRNLKLFCPFCA